jgi:Tol biopolymer transport system component
MAGRFTVTVVVALTFAVHCAEAYAAEPQRLTTDGMQKMDPVFRTGGREIVFTRLETPYLLCLMRMPLESDALGRISPGKIERIHGDAKTNESEASYSADGRWLVFQQTDGNLHLRLVIRDEQNGQEVQFNPGDGFAGVRAPMVAPDGSCVLYSLPDGGGQQIVALGIDGRNPQPLTGSLGINNWPRFSPDGRHIAFGSTRDGNYEIYRMNANGSQPQRLTNDPHQDMRPAWSPDGRRIAFTSARDGNYEIYVMRADVSHLVRVTNHPERDDYAAWHPDGRRLLILSERDGQHDFYLVDAPSDEGE